MRKLPLVLAFLLVLTACTPLEQQARNTAAALQGIIVAAQAQELTTCTANPTQSVCQLINKGVSGQNALITAIETYCGWSTTTPPTNPNQTCVPVKSATAALQAAIANAAELTVQIKGAI